MAVSVATTTTFYVHLLCFARFLFVANAKASACGSPQKIDFATHEQTSGGYFIDVTYPEMSEFTYRCNEGYDKSKDNVGTIVCLRGKWTWNEKNFRCCSDPNCKECGPPPTIAHGYAKKFNIGPMGNTVGNKYTYVCEVDYENATRLSSVQCTSDLVWETVWEDGRSAFNLYLPECRLKHTASGDYYDDDDDDTSWYSINRKKRRSPTKWENIMYCAILGCLVIFMVIGCIRRYYVMKAIRERAVVVSGGTTTVTQYTGPTGYSEPPPTLIAAPMVFPPPSGPRPYPTQAGIYPQESYPLTSQNSAGLDAPPQQYNSATAAYKSATPAPVH